MAERTDVFQWKHTISIPRESFIKRVVTNDDLGYNDLRVCMFLLTELDGWNISHPLKKSASPDPQNYKAINLKQIAKTLDMDKKEVKASIRNLLDEEILEKGSSRSIEDGYRFTFQ